MQKGSLPNVPGLPNEQNLTGEYSEYNRIYFNINRTNSGVYVFSSETSSITYSTSDYPDDSSIFNKGESGMMNLLYKYVLLPYIITPDDIGEFIEKADLSQVAMSGEYKDLKGLPFIPSLSSSSSTSGNSQNSAREDHTHTLESLGAQRKILIWEGTGDPPNSFGEEGDIILVRSK